MAIKSKNDNQTWSIQMLIGLLLFLFLPVPFYWALQPNYSAFIKFPLSLSFTVFLLYAFKKYLERFAKETVRLSLFGNAHKIFVGFIISTLFISVTIVCLFINKQYHVLSVNFSLESQFAWLSFCLLIAVIEEIIFRGIIFRQVSDCWNIKIGLIASALVFGILHIFNKDATLWSSLAIAINGGWLYAIAYAYHQTIWVPIGMHWAWNYLEGGIFGYEISGITQAGIPLITAKITGPALLTGGNYGLVSSIITIATGIGISMIYTILYIKKKTKREIMQDALPWHFKSQYV
jgi:CAAX amino terminal protease family.